MHRTPDQIRHAIGRMELVRDGLRITKMAAHERIAQQGIDALKWVLGEDNQFGRTVDKVDTDVRTANANNN